MPHLMQHLIIIFTFSKGHVRLPFLFMFDQKKIRSFPFDFEILSTLPVAGIAFERPFSLPFCAITIAGLNEISTMATLP